MVTLIHKWLVHRAHEAVGGVVGEIYKSSVMVAQQKRRRSPMHCGDGETRQSESA
jgi:hypothetical protein